MTLPVSSGKDDSDAGATLPQRDFHADETSEV